MSFLEELVKKGIINNSQIDEIKNLAKEKHDGNIDEALVEFGVSEEKIITAKGEYLQMPIKKVDMKEMSFFDALKYIPEDAATHYHFAPIEFKEGVLEVGITDGENSQAIDALQFISAKLGIPFKVFLISLSDYKSIMETYKGISAQVGEALEEINEEETINEKSLNESKTLNKEIKNIKPNEEAKIVEDAPVIKIVAVILRNALEGGASDIHIEFTGEKVKVRFRVDGTLHTTITLPANIYSGVVAPVKNFVKVRLKGKRKTQNGSFSANIDGRKIDFRVSTMPAYYGEKVVMR